MPHDIEVVGSNPPGCLAFSLLYLISCASLIRSLEEVSTPLIFLKKCWAMQLVAKEA